MTLFEVKKNTMSQEIFYENFIRKQIFSKDNSIKEIPTVGEGHINHKESSNNLNYFQTNKNVFHNFNKQKSFTNKFPIICNALKTLTTKNIKKLFSLFQIKIEKETNEELKQDNKEYDKYINPAQIFTILALIGCEVMAEKREENIMNDLKFKLVKNKYLPKNEFMRYRFWFESFFKCNDNNSLKTKKNSIAVVSKSPRKFVRQKTKNLTNTPFRMEKKMKEEEQKNFFIKDLLYNIWLNGKEDMMDFQEFINVLKVNNYISKKVDAKDIYFDIIFDE